MRFVNWFLDKKGVLYLALLLVGILATYLVDANRYGRKRAEKQEKYATDLKKVQEDIQNLFRKSCHGGKDIASLLAIAEPSSNQSKLLRENMEEIKPWELFVISGLEATPLDNLEELPEKLTEKLLLLVEKAKRTGVRIVGMEEKSEKEMFLYHVLPIIGEADKILLVRLRANLILKEQSVKSVHSKYFIEISGPHEKGLLIGDGNKKSSQVVMGRLGLAQVPFTLRLISKEKEKFPWDRFPTYGLGLGMTFAIVSFLALLQKKNVSLEEAKKVVEEDKRKLHELAIKDPLTGIFNRRHFEKLLHAEFQRAKRYDRSLSCIMTDIDHFKNINDIYGHECGDMALKEVANLLKGNLRTVDILARYGGEEFVMILPETDSRDSTLVAERLRIKMENNSLSCKGEKLSVTSSFGVSTMKFDPDITHQHNLVSLADDALYQAKRSGRNRVCCIEKKRFEQALKNGEEVKT